MDTIKIKTWNKNFVEIKNSILILEEWILKIMNIDNDR